MNGGVSEAVDCEEVVSGSRAAAQFLEAVTRPEIVVFDNHAPVHRRQTTRIPCLGSLHSTHAPSRPSACLHIWSGMDISLSVVTSRVANRRGSDHSVARGLSTMVRISKVQTPPCSIAKYAPASNECFLLLPVYLDIISASDPSYCVSTLNAHRLILAAVMISTKFTEDR